MRDHMNAMVVSARLNGGMSSIPPKEGHDLTEPVTLSNAMKEPAKRSSVPTILKMLIDPGNESAIPLNQTEMSIYNLQT